MDFPRRVAAPSPAPAGEAAVAYNACLAICLIHKVVFLEIERKQHMPEIAKNLLALEGKVDRLLDYMEEFADVKKCLWKGPATSANGPLPGNTLG
jgi:formiminotetrahydrofolate cyclodeaminase